MALAAYKNLCLDAADADVAGRFWARTLGLDFHALPGGNSRLTGPTPAHTVWVNTVSEPKVVKHRVHLDVHGASVEEQLACGATVVDADSFRWIVMADPEGAEFCLFVRYDVPRYRLYEVNVDCVDHASMAAWWAAVLGGTVGADTEDDLAWVESIPDAPFHSLVFVTVSEPKTTKNRVHLDVVADDLQTLLTEGATLLRARDAEIDWNVLADPEGNEFCVFTPT